MSAYVRELCFDYDTCSVDVFGNVHEYTTIHERADITAGVQRLYQTRQITRQHIWCVRFYLEGYTLSELKRAFPSAENLLTQFFALLAEEIGYTDEIVINLALRLFPKYATTIDAFRRKLEDYGRSYEGAT